MEVFHAFEKACGKTLRFEYKARRAGDIPVCYCDPAKAKEVLGFETQYDINRMCADSWNWQSKNPYGYNTEEQ